MGAEDRESQELAPVCWAPEAGASWPQVLDTVSDQAPENVPGPREGHRYGKKRGGELGVDWEEGDTGDVGSIPGSGRSPGGENSNLLQYSCLENPMDRGAW